MSPQIWGAVAVVAVSYLVALLYNHRDNASLRRELETKIQGFDRELQTKTDALETKLTARIDTLDTKLGYRIDTLENKLNAKTESVETNLRAQIKEVFYQLRLDLEQPHAVYDPETETLAWRTRDQAAQKILRAMKEAAEMKERLKGAERKDEPEKPK